MTAKQYPTITYSPGSRYSTLRGCFGELHNAGAKAEWEIQKAIERGDAERVREVWAEFEERVKVVIETLREFLQIERGTK